MYHFSDRSLSNLSTCHQDLQTLFKTVIKHRDCTIVSGHRTPEEQNKLYKQGRETEGNIVTYKDGYDKKSNHNHMPSRAVDVVPYPSLYSDHKEIREFGNFVQGVATMLRAYGALEHDIVWGGTWDWEDSPHYEIK